jgi:rubrerythrin
MFGKHDTDDTTGDTLQATLGEEFFGDEAAATNTIHVNELRDRVAQVESQIASQFTSLATYAQIAQEQVELARSEAKASTERSEQRVTSLIERERADRISSYTGTAPAGSAPDVSARIDAVEHSIAQIRKGLDECLARQKALAEAITVMFERLAANATPAPVSADAPLVESHATPVEMPAAFAPPTLPDVTAPVSPLTGPIADLSLRA